MAATENAHENNRSVMVALVMDAAGSFASGGLCFLASSAFGDASVVSINPLYTGKPFELRTHSLPDLVGSWEATSRSARHASGTVKPLCPAPPMTNAFSQIAWKFSEIVRFENERSQLRSAIRTPQGEVVTSLVITNLETGLEGGAATTR